MTFTRSRRTRSTLGAAVVSGLVGFTISNAQAEPPRLSTEGRAEQLFRSGEKKFDSGQHAEACADFSESLKLGPKLGTLLNLALCHETIGRTATAWNEFHHAAAWASQNNQKDRHEFALQHLRALETKLPRVILQLPPERALSAIDLDGEPLPEQAWYLPLYLDPGEHRVAVSAPGKKRTTIAFRVNPSATDQLVAISSLPDDPSLPVAQTGGRRSSTLSTMGFIMLGVGVLGLSAGAILGVAALGQDDAGSVKDLTLGSLLSFAGGAGFAGAGGYLVLTAPSASSGAPRTAGFSLSGTF